MRDDARDKPRTILVVDDEAPVRDVVRTILHRQGHRVLEASSGPEALDIVQAQPPDLVLCDVNLGGMDGFEVLQCLRAQPRTSAIPVVLITGITPDKCSRHSMELGADDFLSKPFTAQTLLAAVEARLARREAIEQLARQNEHRLLEILAATHDLVGMADGQTGRLFYLNAAGRRMLGLAETDTLAGLCLADLHQWEGKAPQPDPFAPNGAPDHWVGECLLRARNGQVVPVSEQVLRHRDAAGAVSYISLVARDMTEQRRAEQQRQQMELQLRQAQKLEAIGRLAAGIAHEINTPTQYIGDNTRFLREAFGDLLRVIEDHRQLLEAARQNSLSLERLAQAEQTMQDADVDYLVGQIPSAIQETLEGIERVTKIVRAMKEFSHPGGKEKSPTDLNKAIETTVTVARNEWKYVAELELDLDPELPLVTCFVGEFNQVILNLIVNAAHAIGDVVRQQPGSKGKITVSTRRVGDQVEVRVSDTGTGIPEAARPHIFEPFFTTKEVGRGTGQGLALVHHTIVRRHGGTVCFETEIGKGTTFIIRLPVEAPDMPEAAGPALPSPAQTGAPAGPGRPPS